MAAIANTPEPPYVAVIFTSLRRPTDDGYTKAAMQMGELAAQQPGYLGIEAARVPGSLGITVSYWATDDDARAWKQVAEHLAIQALGRERWYEAYTTRVATVTREYSFEQAQPEKNRRNVS